MTDASSSIPARNATGSRTVVPARLALELIASIVIAVIAIVAQPGHAQESVRALTSPIEHTPFEVVVRTNEVNCFDSVFPIFSDVQYNPGALSVVLTHMNSPLRRRESTDLCSVERKFTLPGLPRGRHAIKIELTEPVPLSSSASRVRTTLNTTLDVAAASATINFATFWTATFTSAFNNDPSRGTYLTANPLDPWLVEWEFLELPGSDRDHTFKGFSFAATDRLPDALAQLYSVAYPN